MHSRGCRRRGPVASRSPARRPRSATRRPACPGASGVRPVPWNPRRPRRRARPRRPDPRHGPPTAGSPLLGRPAAPPKSTVPPRTAADGPGPRIRAGAASEETAEPRAHRRVPPDTTCRAGQGLQCGSRVNPDQGKAMIWRVRSGAPDLPEAAAPAHRKRTPPAPAPGAWTGTAPPYRVTASRRTAPLKPPHRLEQGDAPVARLVTQFPGRLF